MNLSLYIARRYLFSKHSLNFITIITTISIIGIATGTAALIIVMSIFNGFRELVQTHLIGFDPHVRITADSGAWIKNADSLFPTLRTIPAVQGFAPIISGKILGMTPNSLQAFQIIGVDSDKIADISGVTRTMVAGKFQLNGEISVIPIVMGIGLADKLRLVIGDTLGIISPAGIESSLLQSAVPSSAKAVLVGVFQSNSKEYDAFNAYISRATASRLLRAPSGGATFVDIRGKSVEQTEEIRAELKTKLLIGYRIETWYDLHKDLYDVMRFERMASFIVLALIILVAVFNVFASLTMTVTEKTSEIGVLKALGASPKVITRIFLFEGILVGIFGTGIGVGIGLLACFGQIHFGWLALDTSKYIVSALPVAVNGIDVLLIIGVSLFLTLIAGIFPAQRAANIRTARALIFDKST